MAANPAEYALAALGSCQAITYRVWAAQLGIKLDKVEISIDGDIDLRGFLGIDDRIRAGFNAVRIRVNLNGPEPAARYEELAATVDAHCPGPRQTSGEPRRNFAVRNSSTREPWLFRSPV